MPTYNDEEKEKKECGGGEKVTSKVATKGENEGVERNLIEG